MKKLLSASIAAVIASAPVVAQDKDALRFGAQLSYIIPAGGFSNIASAGLGVGVFGEKPLTDNFSIRGTVDYTNFGKKTDKYYLGVEHDVSRRGITADGIWYFIGHEKGPYVLASLGFQHTIWKITDGGYGESASKSLSDLVYGVGFGFDITSWLRVEIKIPIGHKRKWWEEWFPVIISEYAKRRFPQSQGVSVNGVNGLQAGNVMSQPVAEPLETKRAFPQGRHDIGQKAMKVLHQE